MKDKFTRLINVQMIISQYASLGRRKDICFQKFAEVVGSNPTRSTSFLLYNYGLGMSSILMSVGQI
jgi:hypothetical protein